MYKKSPEVYLNNLRIFVNPLVSDPGATLASDSSAIPPDFAYDYRANVLQTYPDIASAAPDVTDSLTELHLTQTFHPVRKKMHLPDLQHSDALMNSGLLLLAEGAHYL